MEYWNGASCIGMRYHSIRQERSFFCLDTKERTKEKIKAGEKMAGNFSAELKQIIHAAFPPAS